MDELVDILNEDGSPTGKQVMKSEAHASGLFHPTVHIWLYTGDGRVLIQKRGRHKKSFPLHWDVSVAGHIGAGEDIATAAIRETEEELGLTIKQEDLMKFGVFKSVQVHNEHFKDCEFHHCFIAELKLPLSALNIQQSEVDEIKLIPLLTFAEETWGLGKSHQYVPNKPGYYREVVKAIRNELKGLDEVSDLA